MKIRRETSSDSLLIDNYGDGYVTVAGKRFQQCLLICHKHVETLSGLREPQDFNFENTGELLKYNPEVVLLGTGKRLVFPDRSLIKAFQSKGVGCDIMDSGAACRTYNILASEGRTVAAILLMP